MTVQFTIPGEPKGKGRPRFMKTAKYVKTYTPEETAAYENLVKLAYTQATTERFADDAQLLMVVDAYFGIPKSASKKKTEAMLDGEIRPTKKPDADNILKVIADSLNGIAYRDDAQIIGAVVRKRYDTMPRVEVSINDGCGN